MGYTLLAVGLAGYGVLHSLGAHVASTVVWSLGDLMLMGRAFAMVADLAPTGATGRYMAVYGTSWGIAGVTAPLIGTQLLEHAGATALWLILSGACLTLASAQPLLVRTATARSGQVPAHGSQSIPSADSSAR
jgi:hypothetical protein